MSRVSASRMALLGHCAWWAREDAPRVEVEPGDAAKDGTALHALVDAHLRGTLTTPMAREIAAKAADALRVDRLWSQAQEWLKAHKSPWLRSEIAFAWDPATDEAFELTDALATLRLSGPRPYADAEAWARIREALGLSPNAIPGTVDLLNIVDGRVIVYDWCSGRTDKREQLRTLALMVARAMDVEDVQMVTLRLDEESIAEEDHGALDTIDLASLAGELSAQMDRIDGSEPTAGAHCASLYCPAFMGCPTTTEAVAELIPVDRLTAGANEAGIRTYRMSVNIESDEHAAWLLPRVNLLRDAAEAVRDALKGWATEHGGIPSSPGKVWAASETERKSFSREKAEALLRMLGATDEQIASCMTITRFPQFRERPAGRKTRAA